MARVLLALHGVTCVTAPCYKLRRLQRTTKQSSFMIVLLSPPPIVVCLRFAYTVIHCDSVVSFELRCWQICVLCSAMMQQVTRMRQSSAITTALLPQTRSNSHRFQSDFKPSISQNHYCTLVNLMGSGREGSLSLLSKASKCQCVYWTEHTARIILVYVNWRSN